MIRIVSPGKLTAREFLRKFLCIKSDAAYAYFKRPEIWQWHKSNIAKSVLIGCFIAFLPLPCQMILAALASVVFGAYLPLSVALVWISNPITFIPLTWVCLAVGCNLLQIDMTILSHLKTGQYWQTLQTYWQPLIVGSLVCGLSLGLIGYYLTHYSWHHFGGLHKSKKKELAHLLSETDP